MGTAASTVSFLAEPQPVEVHHAGTWRSGVLLGWRHDADGACRVRVSAVVDGLKRTAWVDLATVRLPERAVEHDTRPHRLLRHGDRGARTAPPPLPRPRPLPDGPLRSAWA